MPIYEYECPKCSEIKELLLKLSEIQEDQLCEVHNIKMEKVIKSAYSVRKGAGMYSIDTPSIKNFGDYND